MKRAADMSEERAAFEEARRRARLAQGEASPAALQEAVDRALSLADAMPGEPEVTAAAADLLLEVGRLFEAVVYLEALLESHPDDALRRKLGASYLRLGRLGDAASLLRPALAQDTEGRAHLVLGSVLRYRGRLEEARGLLEAALARAEGRRDRSLTMAALCALGELELDADNPKEAVYRFGRALGLSEYGQDEAETVLPLAGLAQAQGAWGYPGKGAEIAAKALRRAEEQGDPIRLARALLSLGLLHREAAPLYRAAAAADAAPHLPLALRSFVALAELEAGADGGARAGTRGGVRLAEAVRLARRLGMDLDAHRLERLCASRTTKRPRPS